MPRRHQFTMEHRHEIISICSRKRMVIAGGAFAQGAAPAAGPNDAQIASIVVTANQVDIDAGKLAEAKASAKEVKAFGKQMVTDHSGVNQQAVALVTKLKVTPEDNPTSQSLKAGGEENVKKLQGLARRRVRQGLRRPRGGLS